MPLTADQQTIAETSMGLARALVRRLGPGVMDRFGTDELEAVAYLALCQAAECWEEDRGATFAAWAGRLIRQSLWRFTKRAPYSVELEDRPEPDHKAWDRIAWAWVAAWRLHSQLKPGMAKDALAAKIEGQPLAPIARRYGKTKQAAHAAVNALLEHLRKWLEDNPCDALSP